MTKELTALLNVSWSHDDPYYVDHKALTSSPTELAELLIMLTYARPAGYPTEEDFIRRFIEPLRNLTDSQGNYLDYVRDSYGNIIIHVPEKNGDDAVILWSSHTDTVHSTGGRQWIKVLDGQVYSESKDILGADCTTGVWLMINMIRKLVPGRYVFHREEECGGRGSQRLVDAEPYWLEDIKAAIAFDRYGTTSVITHQGGRRCASDEWSRRLAALLGPSFALDDGGVFTDTANYMDVVPECTNISVGYYDQHTKRERQDLSFAMSLLSTMVSTDFSSLHETYRRPEDSEPATYDYSKYYTAWDDAVHKEAVDAESKRVPYTLHELVYEYPSEVADILASYGVTYHDLKADLEARGYFID